MDRWAVQSARSTPISATSVPSAWASIALAPATAVDSRSPNKLANLVGAEAVDTEVAAEAASKAVVVDAAAVAAEAADVVHRGPNGDCQLLLAKAACSS